MSSVSLAGKHLLSAQKETGLQEKKRRRSYF